MSKSKKYLLWIEAATPFVYVLMLGLFKVLSYLNHDGKFDQYSIMAGLVAAGITTIAIFGIRLYNIQNKTETIFNNTTRDYVVNKYTIDEFDLEFGKIINKKNIEHIRVIHMRHDFHFRSNKNVYGNSLKAFLEAGGKYSKVCSYNLSLDADMEKFIEICDLYKGYDYNISIIEGESMKDTTHSTSSMLFDNKLLCLRHSGATQSTVITTESPQLIEFYKDKFDELNAISRRLDKSQMNWHHINQKMLATGRVKVMPKSEDFEKYLEKRVDNYINIRNNLKHEEEKNAFTLDIKAIHLSNHFLYSSTTKYSQILQKLLANNGSYTRLISKFSDKENYNILKSEQEWNITPNTYVLDNFTAQFNSPGIMLFHDNNKCTEVVVGGSYMDKNLPNISYGENNQIKFYDKYYYSLFSLPKTQINTSTLQNGLSENTFKVIQGAHNFSTSVFEDLKLAKHSLRATSFGPEQSNPSGESNYYDLIVDKINKIDDFTYCTAFHNKNGIVAERKVSFQKLKTELGEQLQIFKFEEKKLYLNILIIDDAVAYLGFPNTAEDTSMKTVTRTTNITDEGKNYIDKLTKWYESNIESIGLNVTQDIMEQIRKQE